MKSPNKPTSKDNICQAVITASVWKMRLLQMELAMVELALSNS